MSKTSDQVRALANANAPTNLNPVATIADTGGGGGGDVTGPAGGVVADELAVYSDTTGKVIKGSGGAKVVDFATAAQGALADSATQPGDNVSTLTNDAGYIADITGENLNDLSDVVITAPSNSEVLQYSGGNWVNGPAPGGGSGDVTGPGSAINENIAVFDGTTGKIIKDGLAKISDFLTSLANAVFPDSAHFSSEIDNSGTNPTVNFNSGNKQRCSNASVGNITLSAPGVGNYMLRIVNSTTHTFVTSIKWDSGTAPTWAGESVVALYYDGTTWYGSATVGVA